jgi:FtsZ-binding cell division protein ZapB
MTDDQLKHLKTDIYLHDLKEKLSQAVIAIGMVQIEVERLERARRGKDDGSD